MNSIDHLFASLVTMNEGFALGLAALALFALALGRSLIAQLAHARADRDSPELLVHLHDSFARVMLAMVLACASALIVLLAVPTFYRLLLGAAISVFLVGCAALFIMVSLWSVR